MFKAKFKARCNNGRRGDAKGENAQGLRAGDAALRGSSPDGSQKRLERSTENSEHNSRRDGRASRRSRGDAKGENAQGLRAGEAALKEARLTARKRDQKEARNTQNIVQDETTWLRVERAASNTLTRGEQYGDARRLGARFGPGCNQKAIMGAWQPAKVGTRRPSTWRIVQSEIDPKHLLLSVAGAALPRHRFHECDRRWRPRAF
jgi:hypothetical protein